MFALPPDAFLFKSLRSNMFRIFLLFILVLFSPFYIDVHFGCMEVKIIAHNEHLNHKNLIVNFYTLFLFCENKVQRV